MIKGVNRQMVEVKETGSEYFERILFIVKPEYANMQEHKLREQVDAITNSAGSPPPTRRKKFSFLSFAKMSAAVGAGAAVTAILTHL